jgi:DNA-binding GntR family transcriptional regulator
VSVSRKEQVYADLRQRVLTLDLAPGLALDEVALSEHYGLSRTPLRELFHRLAGAGYLSTESNRGASVSSMDLDTMRSFFQSAPMIYAAIARLAAEHASAAQITELKKIQTRFRKAVDRDRAADMAMHNHRFHEFIGEMAASPYLAPSLDRLLIDHTRMSHRFYRIKKAASKKRVLEAALQHDAMIDAFAQQQPAQAVELTLAHWELSRTEMDKYVMPDPLPTDAAIPAV